MVSGVQFVRFLECWHIHGIGQNLSLHFVISSFLEWTAKSYSRRNVVCKSFQRETEAWKSKKTQVTSARLNARPNGIGTSCKPTFPRGLTFKRPSCPFEWTWRSCSSHKKASPLLRPAHTPSSRSNGLHLGSNRFVLSQAKKPGSSHVQTDVILIQTDFFSLPSQETQVALCSKACNARSNGRCTWMTSWKHGLSSGP